MPRGARRLDELALVLFREHPRNMWHALVDVGASVLATVHRLGLFVEEGDGGDGEDRGADGVGAGRS